MYEDAVNHATRRRPRSVCGPGNRQAAVAAGVQAAACADDRLEAFDASPVGARSDEMADGRPGARPEVRTLALVARRLGGDAQARAASLLHQIRFLDLPVSLHARP